MGFAGEWSPLYDLPKKAPVETGQIALNRKMR